MSSSCFIREGRYAAELESTLIDDETPWAPIVAKEDVFKTDRIRLALRQKRRRCLSCCHSRGSKTMGSRQPGWTCWRSQASEDYKSTWEMYFYKSAAGGVVALAGLLIALSAKRPVAKSG